MQTQRGTVLPGDGFGDREHRTRHGERNDLDGGDEVFCRHHREVGQRAKGERFIYGVEAVHLGGVHPQQSGHFGLEIHPTGGGAGARQQGCDERFGQTIRGDIFRHVARLQAGDNDLGMAGGAELHQRRVVESGALADHAISDPLRMGGDGSLCIIQRNRGRTSCRLLLRHRSVTTDGDHLGDDRKRDFRSGDGFDVQPDGAVYAA